MKTKLREELIFRLDTDPVQHDTEKGMSYSLSTFPWEHHVVYDVFHPLVFDIIQQEVETWPKTPKDKRRLSMFILDQKVDGYIYCPWMHDLLSKKFKAMLRNFDRVNYKMIFEYNTCPEGYQYPIHCDAPEKIASMVLYINGEGSGTSLYTEDKEFAKKVPWKFNSGMYFENDLDTWHSYDSIQDHRDTINCILVKNDKELLKNLRYDVDV